MSTDDGGHAERICGGEALDRAYGEWKRDTCELEGVCVCLGAEKLPGGRLLVELIPREETWEGGPLKSDRRTQELVPPDISGVRRSLCSNRPVRENNKKKNENQ